jgi:ribosomal protein S18 acetylase RimI-like enzyme
MIRAATPADIPALLELLAGDRSAHAETPDTAESLRRVIDHGALLVTDDLSGMVIAAFDGWRGNMYRLVVRRDRRREGIARELVRAGEARLRAKGAPKVTALVGRGDAAAEGLWRAAGYEDDVAIGRWVRSLP